MSEVSTENIKCDSFPHEGTIILPNNGKEVKTVKNIVHTGVSRVFFKGDPKVKNNDTVLMEFPKMCECDAIIFVSKNYNDFPLSFCAHAPPGSFGRLIDNNEHGNVPYNINEFIDKIKYYGKSIIELFNLGKNKIDFELIFIGYNVNPHRVTYLENEISKINFVNSVLSVSKSLICDGYKISSFTISEISSNFKLISRRENNHMIIRYMIYKSKLIDDIECNIINVEGRGENKGKNNYYYAGNIDGNLNFFKI